MLPISYCNKVKIKDNMEMMINAGDENTLHEIIHGDNV